MGGYQIPAERQNSGILGGEIPRHIVVNRSGGHGGTSLASSAEGFVGAR